VQKQTSPLNPRTYVVSQKNKKKPNNGNTVKNTLNLAADPLFILLPITTNIYLTIFTNSNIMEAI
jgi:hypothetical protein